MRIGTVLFFFAALVASARAFALEPKAAEPAVEEDLRLILDGAGLPRDQIRFVRQSSAGGSTVAVKCSASGKITLTVRAPDNEWAPTFYLGLQKLGFLFPHPRIAKYPSATRLTAVCGSTYVWDPRLKFRGFHFHTEHPNEWVRGFLDGDEKIAVDTVRWLARNGQNTMDVVLLRTIPLDLLAQRLKRPFELARSLGVLTGVDVSFAMKQQKAYALADHGGIEPAILELARKVAFDFLVVELGTTEFTSSDYHETLKWLETASHAIESSGRDLFAKIHVSVNQTDPHYGNYNFLPQYSSRKIGVWPHTVMYYGLDDSRAPVYGRADFSDMKKFLLGQTPLRPAWYFPETSYWVGMDIDVPLFLTDYLVARSEDMDVLTANHVPGQITFTSGQELGYWLMDWTSALLVNRENAGNPYVGLALLGEDVAVWKKIVDFQTKLIKKPGLLPLLSGTTLLDEIPLIAHPVHERVLLRDLKGEVLRQEISLLENAVEQEPSLAGVHDRELASVLQLTWNRIAHALAIRKALTGALDSPERTRFLEQARQIRERSLLLVKELEAHSDRYPEAELFKEHKSLTSYAFGYLWTAATLHFWQREEEMVRSGDFSPFFMNIYDPWALLF
jgi:hypothetical protein